MEQSNEITNGLRFTFISRELQKSEYDWVDIEYNNCRVGKARCLIEGSTFTIYTITIYPEFQGKGYGKAFVNLVKRQYRNVKADRVRFAAIGFWENVGFIKNGETTWIYKKP